jgi:hypothetical protein
VLKLLNRDPSARLTAQQVLWLPKQSQGDTKPMIGSINR